ncbi:MAG: B12-binding domain-containing radical SAM protein [Bacteriovoracaceae bacterium]
MKKRKVVLVGIAGSHKAFSLSLYNLKSFAFARTDLKNNWDIEVVQLPLITDPDPTEVSELASKILEQRPELVGLSCYIWNIQFFAELGKILRKKDPAIKLLYGGPEMARDWVVEGRFDDYAMDFCVSGEGELTFTEVLSELQATVPDFGKIHGLSFRQSDSEKFQVNPKRTAFKNLMEVPSPYLNGIVDDELFSRENLEANLETQRGCTLRCSYCIYHKDMDKIAYSQIERTLEEVSYVTSRGVKSIRFVDANFSSDLNHAKTIMRGLIERKIESKLMFELIPGFIDEELARLFDSYNRLHDRNEITLGVGVQTIHLPSLQLIRRAISMDRFETTFSLLQKYQIYAKIDLIIGMPGESIVEIEKTLEYFMDKLKGSHSHLLCCHLMRGLPGTELLEIARKHQMEFSSRYDPHEFYESPDLPRKDLVKTLRRTALIFRLVNHSGWADREFIFENSGQLTNIHDAYYATRDRLKLSNLQLIDRMTEALLKELPPSSYFVQEDFPHAETWWWTRSKWEIDHDWIMNFFGRQ